MPREKIAGRGSEREVVYDKTHWMLLEEKRKIAKEIMEAFVRMGIQPIVHGSIARGDVHRDSDIDVFIPYTVSSFIIETVLAKIKKNIYYKKIVQATPTHTPKAYFSLDPQEKIVVSFPLCKLLKRELEFYYFGGAIGYSELLNNIRVPGVNKKLEIIIPTKKGHYSYSIVGRESEVAKILKISIDTIQERIRILSRRDAVGRTGVFFEKYIEMEYNVESALEELVKKNPGFKKQFEERCK